MSINKFNKEGYYDPTTYHALKNIIHEEAIDYKKNIYRPLVYVCSPYAGDIENNVKNACKYSRFTVENNGIPVVPHLMYPQFMDDSIPEERELAMHFNFVLLGKCNELWVFGGVVSKGMSKEISIARKRRCTIRWFDSDLEEVKEYD